MSEDQYADARQAAERRGRMRRAATRLIEAIGGCVGDGPCRIDEKVDDVIEAMAEMLDIFDESSRGE